MVKGVGHIEVPGDVDVWPHEFNTARALARAGHNVIFIKKSKQAPRVVFDGRRMKLMTDKQILREIEKWLPTIKSCKRLKYINRSGEIIDIK